MFKNIKKSDKKNSKENKIQEGDLKWMGSPDLRDEREIFKEGDKKLKFMSTRKVKSVKKKKKKSSRRFLFTKVKEFENPLVFDYLKDCAKR